ncbi:MAG TPA: fused MFS/spermidine synthase, partial [Prosthecobacter sp.]
MPQDSSTAPTPSPSSVAGSVKPARLFLGAACFFSGAAMMVIEISAARLLSPLFGNSVYTWTALIGVILIAFSVGGFFGGRLADRRAGIDVLGWLLGGVAVLTFFIPALSTWFGPAFAKGGLIDGPVMFSLFLLAVPGALLGAVSPAAVRLYSLTFSDTHIGGAAGTISMLGSLGSFVGTFLSGFFLLGSFGVRSIFIGTGVLLLLLALLAFVLAGKGKKAMAKVV